MHGKSVTATADPVSDPGSPDLLTGTPELRTSNGRRAMWTFADQALSSLTNAGVAIVVALSVNRDDFGAFSLALVTFGFAVGLARALVGEPFMVRYSAVDDERRRRAMTRAAGTALSFGVLAGVACLVVSVLTGGHTSEAYLALAVCMPGLCVQDTWRHMFFAAGRPAAATVNDLVWTVLQFAALAALLAAGVRSIFLITLTWGASACVAALVGVAQTRIVPRPAAAGKWMRQNWDLNSQLAMGFVLNAGSVQIGTYAVGGIVGVVGVGALRAAQVVLGPLNLIFSGFNAFALPMLARRVAAGQRLVRFAVPGSAVLTVVATGWVGLLLVLPDAVGTRILGDSWQGAQQVMLPSGLVMICGALVLGASNSLIALSRSDLMLWLTLVQAPLMLVLGLIGAWQWGYVGAAYGFAISQAVGLVVCWCLFLRADASPRPAQP